MEKDIIQKELNKSNYQDGFTANLKSSLFSFENQTSKNGIFDLIKEDHRIILKLLESFEQEKDLRVKSRQFKSIKTFFLLYIYLKEKVLYPALDIMKATHKLIKKFNSENETIVFLLNDIVNNAYNQKWEKNYLFFKKYLENHIKEEESTLFSIATNTLREQQIIDLARIYKYEKRRILNLHINNSKAVNYH
jgi:hypothetical protein